MKLLVLGAGGIGGYFGGRLAEAGVDVTFLVRARRRAQLERDGLRVKSALGDITLMPRLTSAEEVGPGYDLILLTSKAYDLDSAIAAIAPAMDGSCRIVPMLNGMAHFDELDARFGRTSILGGTCAIAATLHPDGTITHAGTLQRLVFGVRDPSQDPAARAFAAMLGRSTIEWELSSNIDQDLWEKIVFLSALAATTCLFRGNVGEIIAAPGGLAAIERALASNVAIAARAGHRPRETAMAFARAGLTSAGSTWSSSTLRDLEAGRAVESDHIIGWMLDRAREQRLDDTILSLAFTHLKTYELKPR
jgi:2-dehydropantoate 2-reductase